MDIRERISEWVDAHEEKIIGDISRLVAIRSVASEPAPGMPFGEGPAAVLAEAEKLCEEHGLRVTNYDNYALSADLNENESAVDILAHLDVVAEGEGWSSDPYKAEIRDGCLYGRGTDDDKGPAVASVYALSCLRELGIPLKKNARLILGTDEESGSKDIEYYYSKVPPAPNTFSPDASFPVYNTEKGMFRCTFSRKWDEESAVPRVTRFSGGFRINVLPSDAEADVAGISARTAEKLLSERAGELGVLLTAEDVPEGARLHVKGRSSHASTPEEGNNGITALIELLCLLPLAGSPGADALKKLKELFPHGDGEGKALGIDMRDDVSGALSVAFSLLKMDGSGIEGSFDSRVPICANDENCRRKASAALGSAGFAVSGEMRPPHHTAADTPFINNLLSSYEYYTGRKGECLYMGGGTYVHDVEGGVAFGASMPGFDSHLHGADERVNIKDLLTACKIFAYAVYTLCR